MTKTISQVFGKVKNLDKLYQKLVETLDYGITILGYVDDIDWADIDTIALDTGVIDWTDITAILADTANIDALVQDATNGLAAIKSKVNDVYTEITSTDTGKLFGKVKKMYDFFIGLDDVIGNAFFDWAIEKVLDRFEGVWTNRHEDMDKWAMDLAKLVAGNLIGTDRYYEFEERDVT